MSTKYIYDIKLYFLYLQKIFEFPYWPAKIILEEYLVLGLFN